MFPSHLTAPSVGYFNYLPKALLLHVCNLEHLRPFLSGSPLHSQILSEDETTHGRPCLGPVLGPGWSLQLLVLGYQYHTCLQSFPCSTEMNRRWEVGCEHGGSERMKWVALQSCGQKHLSEKGQARSFPMRSHSFALGTRPRGTLAFLFKGADMGGDVSPINTNVPEVATGLFPTGCDCPCVCSHSHYSKSLWCSLMPWLQDPISKHSDCGLPGVPLVFPVTPSSRASLKWWLLHCTAESRHSCTRGPQLSWLCNHQKVSPRPFIIYPVAVTQRSALHHLSFLIAVSKQGTVFTWILPTLAFMTPSMGFPGHECIP